ncbi:MAG: hypothetical protein QXQ02_04810 [Halobacteria archaeon]
MEIDIRTTLERFRRFIIYNTCLSFIPKGYLKDPTIFPERSSEKGEIYVEAASKVELAKIRDLTFIKAADILGVIYRSKTGNTYLKWRQIKGSIARLTGVASPNSILHLIEARVITREYVEEVLKELSTQPSTSKDTSSSSTNNAVNNST